MSESILLNGKAVLRADIDQIKPNTEFESNILSFWRDWYSGKNDFLLKTSGSTGTPKSIALTRHQLEVSAKMTLSALGLQKKNTALICLDNRYIAGKMMLVRSWVGELNIVAVEPSANPFETLQDTPSIDFVALVPYQVKAILQSPRRSWFNRIRHIIVGGAPLDEDTKQQLQNYQSQFYETFGMTETLSHIALKKINGAESSPFFKILPGVSIRVDERSCLCIQAPHLTSEVITNDVVTLKNETEFQWLGRWDNVINTGGVKVFPEEIEKKIAPVFTQLHMTNRFFVAGLPDSNFGEKVTLIIESPAGNIDSETIRKGLNLVLTKFEQPKDIVSLPTFVETENGKLNRKKTVTELLTNQ